jgi:hypothetical protein
MFQNKMKKNNLKIILILSLIILNNLTSCKNKSNIKTFDNQYISDNIIYAKNIEGIYNFYQINLKGFLIKDTIKTPILKIDSFVISKRSNIFIFQYKFDNELKFQLDTNQVKSINQPLIDLMFKTSKESLKIKRDEIQRNLEILKKNQECFNYFILFKSTLEDIRTGGSRSSQVYFADGDRFYQSGHNAIWFSQVKKVVFLLNLMKLKLELHIYDFNGNICSFYVDVNDVMDRRTLFKISKILCNYLSCKFNKEITPQFELNIWGNTTRRNIEDLERIKSEYYSYTL